MEMKKTIIAVMMACLPILSQAQTKEFACWDTYGQQMKLVAEEMMLRIPDMVAAIDLRNVEAITLDCTSANPNCLFYTNGATAVEGLPNANVVCDGICDGLLLTDQACFYCPMAFTATDAMLRFTPRRDDGEDEAYFYQPCYETIVLPFDADLVIPADADGPLPKGWLQAGHYCGYEDKMLLFTLTDAEQLIADIPYMVKFEYAAYGSQILFCGENKTVKETKAAINYATPFSFVGITTSAYEETLDFRYYRGQEQYFIHTGKNQLMEPFRCYITSGFMDENEFEKWITENPGSIFGKGDGDSPEKVLRYTIATEELPGDGEATGIDTHNNYRTSKMHFDLQGRPLGNGNRSKGIYIIDGIKVIK